MVGKMECLKCRLCKKIKSVNDFYKNKYPDSYHTNCKPCDVILSTEYHRENYKSVKRDPLPGSPELEKFINLTLAELAL